MATSDVQICSNALLLLGQEPIDTFADDSDRATLAVNLWPTTRDAVLRMHPWNCAIKRVLLSPDDPGPAYEWSYQFTLPGDFMRVSALGEVGEVIPYQLEAGKILCNESALKLRYVYRLEDVTKWDSLLTKAAEAAMAEAMAYPITKSASVQEVMAQKLQFWLRQARTVDGHDSPPEDQADQPLLTARY